jgi:hypothetical protein
LLSSMALQIGAQLQEAVIWELSVH